ncbi:amidophosphoribosyltransferase [Frankia sp. CcI156]|uniref:Amidophosphoribosyltransferase n=1 Tax=Frankia casuarinae (strain DSM 45818 / CECT 9043 / HFP020203 / CcI3) TaxID=106370 RepID=Q2JGV4_FRACC|nr:MULTISPECIES: amidophosphoribosyltransferase [Frankia]ABD09488.1 amidophosphoribosyltransferase [Frankia casuarinae]ETA02821.1 amidophosphoribosyltransferase [Frankia sp. CcI6]EYT94106.1 amidophosphoribosyltransferase [Frankia casuarinae]KEZ35897.1 amidophosphoribosyltransferase [Frankia sp. CeD]OHV52301.1 amidophosphoribosyltransferase [Frankia sp. CgIS1]
MPDVAPRFGATPGWESDLSDEPGPRDACGVFGVWAPGEDVANLAYYGLYALQHRGQEAAGIAVGDGRTVVVFKELGLVAQVFDEVTLSSLSGHVAVGHTRYSTTGSSTWENAQPSYRTARFGGPIALGHNGNLTNIVELARTLGAERDRLRATTDSDLITAMLADHPGPTLVDAAMDVLPRLTGAFSLVFSDASTLYAARDAHGIHPLVLGRLDGHPDGAWIIASETAALDIVGATLVREIVPGELVVIDAEGVRSRTFARPDPHGCLFEYVYLARPDTSIAGRSVHATRVDVGRQLAREAPVEADLVIPVPQSGVPAAVGYAEESGIPFGEGLVKNSYVGRTFIQPSQTIRQRGIRLKLNPLRDVIEGRRLVVVDDSIVRGNTQRALVRMLREAGAAEVHIRISSPPVRWPCFYGIDFATRAELIASEAGIEEIRASLGADSLAYVSLEGLVEASRQPAGTLCRACFDGVYPVPLNDSDKLGKHRLEATGGAETTEDMIAEALRRGVTLGMNGADPSPDNHDAEPEPEPDLESEPEPAGVRPA